MLKNTSLAHKAFAISQCEGIVARVLRIEQQGTSYRAAATKAKVGEEAAGAALGSSSRGASSSNSGRRQ